MGGSGCMGALTSLRPQFETQLARIASIGVKVDVHGISRHGFALNVATQPENWEGIVACGLQKVQMASLADFLQPVPDMAQVREAVTYSFEDVFHCHLRSIDGL